jgi:hypothetical protein
MSLILFNSLNFSIWTTSSIACSLKSFIALLQSSFLILFQKNIFLYWYWFTFNVKISCTGRIRWEAFLYNRNLIMCWCQYSLSLKGCCFWTKWCEDPLYLRWFIHWNGFSLFWGKASFILNFRILFLRYLNQYY